MKRFNANRKMRYRNTDSEKGSIFGNNGIRLSFLSRQYEMNNETGETKCRLKCRINLPNMDRKLKLSDSLKRRIAEGFLNDTTSWCFEVSASVRTSDGDIFNETTGRILSEARAKEKAYNKAGNIERRIASLFKNIASEFSEYSVYMQKCANNERKRYKRFGKIED